MIPDKQPLPPAQVRSIRRIGFLALDGFPMVALSCAIEVLRTANQIADAVEYTWTVITTHGNAVRANDGATQVSAIRYADAGELDLVLVCGDSNIEFLADEPLNILLHQMANDGAVLGGMCSGTYALLNAGLMDGYNCTIQWDDMALLRCAHVKVNFLDRLSVIDRDRLTCAGGCAPIALMLSLIATRFDAKMVADISMRVGTRNSRPLEEWECTLGSATTGPERRVLSQIITLMQENLEEPLSAGELAKAVGVSLRQVQRLFQVALGSTLSNYYLRLRLEHARSLVLESETSLTEIAVTCGFASSAHFSRSYRSYYGRPPSSERPRRWVIQDGR